MPCVPEVPASFRSRRSPVCIRRAALATHGMIMTEEFATSMASLEGSPSDATDPSLLAKQQPLLSLSLKKHSTMKCFRSPIKKEKFEATAQCCDMESIGPQRCNVIMIV